MSTEVLTLGPSSASWQEILNDQTFVSQTGVMQAQLRSGNRWGLVLAYQNLTGTRRSVMEGHAFQARGKINRLQVPMSLLGYVRGGAGGGTPLLQGGQTAGSVSLAIDGATSVTNWLKAGDWISIGNELKKVTKNLTTSGGAGTIQIWPELHQTRSDNFAVDIVTPKGIFYLAEPIAFTITPYPGDVLLDALVLNLIEDITA